MSELGKKEKEQRQEWNIPFRIILIVKRKRVFEKFWDKGSDKLWYFCI